MPETLECNFCRISSVASRSLEYAPDNSPIDDTRCGFRENFAREVLDESIRLAFDERPEGSLGSFNFLSELLGLIRNFRLLALLRCIW